MFMWHFTDYNHYGILKDKIVKHIEKIVLKCDDGSDAILKEDIDHIKWRDKVSEANLRECISGGFSNISTYAEDRKLRSAWLVLSEAERKATDWSDFYNSKLCKSVFRPDEDIDDEFEAFRIHFRIPAIRFYERYLRSNMVEVFKLREASKTASMLDTGTSPLSLETLDERIADIFMSEWVQLFLRQDIIGDQLMILTGKGPMLDN